jgi:heme-binding protein
MRTSLRRSLYGVFATCALAGAAAAIALPSSTAATDPCAASEIARTIGSVSTNTGNYLDSHPATNAALTGAAQQQPQQALTTLKTYFDANPAAGKDIQTIQQPLQNLATQCKLPISIPQALQLIQGVGQGGQLPGGLGLPGGTPSPLGNAAPGATTPAGGTAAVPAATGPLPGPAPTASH